MYPIALQQLRGGGAAPPAAETCKQALQGNNKCSYSCDISALIVALEVAFVL